MFQLAATSRLSQPRLISLKFNILLYLEVVKYPLHQQVEFCGNLKKKKLTKDEQILQKFQVQLPKNKQCQTWLSARKLFRLVFYMPKRIFSSDCR